MKALSEQLLTRIDSFILRSLELEPTLNHSKLEERIKNRYGVEVSVKERLKEYTPPKDNNFLYWN